MTARNDINIPDFVVGATLPSSGTVALATPGTPVQASIVSLLGTQALSITAQTLAGSTAVGSIAVQCTDIKTDADGNYDPTIGWAALNYPNTSTPITLAIATGANTVNIQANGNKAKLIRIVYTATSGTGTVNIGVTLGANSRT